MIFPAKPNPEIHEIITWEQKEGPPRYCKVVFTMLSDPTLMGSVLNEAEEIDAGKSNFRSCRRCQELLLCLAPSVQAAISARVHSSS